MLNKAGYFTLPHAVQRGGGADRRPRSTTTRNDPNYLTQKLDKVYVNPDKRTYPLSSYVYAIIPTAADDSRMTTAKRQTDRGLPRALDLRGPVRGRPDRLLAAPINLVQSGFTQVNKLKLADDGVQFDASIIQDVKNCHNPTFVAGKPAQNYLAKIAPVPGRVRPPGPGSVRRGRRAPSTRTRTTTARCRHDPAAGPVARQGREGRRRRPRQRHRARAAAPRATVRPEPPRHGRHRRGRRSRRPDRGRATWPTTSGSAAVRTANGGATAAVVATTLNPDGSSGPPGVLTALVVGLFVGTLVVVPTVGQPVRLATPRPSMTQRSAGGRRHAARARRCSPPRSLRGRRGDPAGVPDVGAGDDGRSRGRSPPPGSSSSRTGPRHRVSSNQVTLDVAQTNDLRGRQEVAGHLGGARPDRWRRRRPQRRGRPSDQEYPFVLHAVPWRRHRRRRAGGARPRLSPETCWTQTSARALPRRGAPTPRRGAWTPAAAPEDRPSRRRRPRDAPGGVPSSPVSARWLPFPRGRRYRVRRRA